MSEVIFNGPAGRIEGRYHVASQRNAPIALIIHPHPQHGGTMHHKVNYALYRCFSDRGFSTLRFNFRGVGRSEGKFDQGEGELNDAAAALDWLQSHNAHAPQCWVAGFSFGAWISMQLLMRRPEISAFISVSPPADRYDFNFLAPCPVSGQIMQGQADPLVEPESVQRLVTKLKLQRGLEIIYEVIPGADHFYTNCLHLLAQRVGNYIDIRSKTCGLKATG